MLVFNLTSEEGEELNIGFPVWNGILIPNDPDSEQNELNHTITSSEELLGYYDSNTFLIGCENAFSQYHRQCWEKLNESFKTNTYSSYGSYALDYIDNLHVVTKTIYGNPIKWYAPNGYYATFTSSGSIRSVVVYDKNDNIVYSGNSGWIFGSIYQSSFNCIVPDSGDYESDDFYVVPVAMTTTYYQREHNIFLGNPQLSEVGCYNKLEWLKALYTGIKPEDTEDPYDGGETSGTDGGGGNYDNSSDPIDIPSLPTTSATDSGFLNLFVPNKTQIKNLADYVWSDLFDLDGWRKIFANPMDAIINLSIVPFTPTISGNKYVAVGNINTSVIMSYTSQQFYEVDCGSIDIKQYFGAYLDYAPYTKAEIYLPYVGIHQLDIDDIMKSTVRVVYHIDILTGSCIAFVKVGNAVLYSYPGQCSSSVPITSSNYSGALSSAVNVACSIGSMIGTGGVTAPTEVTKMLTSSSGIQGMKPSVEKSGNLSSTCGLMGTQKPYIILTRPRQSKPKDLPKYTGYPCNVTYKLSNVKGYTEVDSINLSNVDCTDNERNEILSLLKGGVIF